MESSIYQKPSGANRCNGKGLEARDQQQKLVSKQQELLHEASFRERRYCQRELLLQLLFHLKSDVDCAKEQVIHVFLPSRLQYVQTARLVLFHVALNKGNCDPECSHPVHVERTWPRFDQFTDDTVNSVVRNSRGLF